MIRTSELGIGHAVGAVGVVSLCISAGLFASLHGSKESLGRDVERSVRSGIQDGVDEALAPEKIESRSAAVGRGLIGGVIDGAAERAGGEGAERLAEGAAKGVLKGVDAAVGVGVEVLGADLTPTPERERTEAHNELASPPARRPSAVREVEEIAVKGIDLGFDLLDAALGAKLKSDESEGRGSGDVDSRR